MRNIRKIQQSPAQAPRLTRVAAYARVSSGKDAMLHSLSAQISYYNDYIQRRADWSFAGIYADEAKTGTKASRPEFMRMLDDCRAGKIDMIVTKSITRFARNTVTLLEAVRELKLLRIDVFFEKENIHTLSADGELMLTLLASYAQEESRSVSENQKWRIRKMFRQGRPNTGRMLGYRLVDGVLRIVPDEAEIVRRIFSEYLEGRGAPAIAKALNADGAQTVNGGRWRESTIMSVLRNEKYTGDMLLQKTYVADPITKKGRINRGELPMYRVEASHRPIVTKDVYDGVQREIDRRAACYSPKGSKPPVYPFTGKLKCGICGASYRRKQTALGTKYNKAVWICATFNSVGKDSCPSKQIPEYILMAKAAKALGLESFDETVFADRVDFVQMLPDTRLRFVFLDGHSVEAAWSNPSRRQSWTEEMKQAAREKALERQGRYEK